MASPLGVVAILGAMVLVVLDAAIANVALPTIAAAFEISPAGSVRVVTAYQTALVMALLPCAALGESRGHRPVFLSGIALSTAASAACALAPNLAWLVAARFVQGLGGAAVMALGVALLRLCVPPERIGLALGWNALAVALGSAAGPAIGAAILAYASWPWLFAAKIPLGLAVLAASGSLPRAEGPTRRPDALSIGISAGTFGAFVSGVSFAPDRPPSAFLLLALAGLGLATLVRRERSSITPVVPFDLLRSRVLRRSAIASVFCFAGQTAGLVALPFHLQKVLGPDPLTAGLAMATWPLAVALAAPIAGRLSDRIPTASLCGLGAAILATGLGALAAWPAEASALALVPFSMSSGLGFALFNVPNNRNLLLAAPPERSGAAGGLQGTARLTGQTLGAIAMTMLFEGLRPDLAPRVGFAVGALSALVAGMVSVSVARAIPLRRRSRFRP